MNTPLPWNDLLPQDLPTPCFVVDEERLLANLAVLADVQQRTGVKILLALKGFAMFSTFPLLRDVLHGTCASSPHEARLGREEFGREVHAFAAAYSRQDMEEITQFADHVVFNSFAQYRRFLPVIDAARAGGRDIECALRINPEHSEGAVAIYNPCSSGSRLGIRRKDFEGQNLEGISGLHFHTLCEQGAEPLARTLEAVEANFGEFLPQMSRLNFGGGHHITKAGYNIDLLCRCIDRIQQKYGVQVYLEPGEAVALDAGVLVSTVLDVIEADMPIAVLDTSAAAHMPDVLEMPYRPGVIVLGTSGKTTESDKRGESEHDRAVTKTDNATEAGVDAAGTMDEKSRKGGEPGEKVWTCSLAGKSCLAGDVIGEYSFDRPLAVGDRVAFLDMAHYSMVKTTTFNGLGLPSIAATEQGTHAFKIIRRFGYQDFLTRLS